MTKKNERKRLQKVTLPTGVLPQDETYIITSLQELFRLKGEYVRKIVEQEGLLVDPNPVELSDLYVKEDKNET